MNNKQRLYHINNRFNKSMYRSNNQISYTEAREIMKKSQRAILIDVRSKQEYKEYHLAGAICIPTYEIANKIPQIITEKEQVIIVYCQCGVRSKKAIALLNKMGYRNVYEIQGGLDNWIN